MEKEFKGIHTKYCVWLCKKERKHGHSLARYCRQEMVDGAGMVERLRVTFE